MTRSEDLLGIRTARNITVQELTTMMETGRRCVIINVHTLTVDVLANFSSVDKKHTQTAHDLWWMLFEDANVQYQGLSTWNQNAAQTYAAIQKTVQAIDDAHKAKAAFDAWDGEHVDDIIVHLKQLRKLADFWTTFNICQDLNQSTELECRKRLQLVNDKNGSAYVLFCEINGIATTSRKYRTTTILKRLRERYGP